MSDYTTTELINQVKLYGAIPVADTTVSNEDILRFMNFEMKSYIVPFVLRAREEFYVKESNYTIQAGVDRYAIPERALASKIRDIYLMDGENFIPIARQEPDNRPWYTVTYNYSYSQSFYVENNEIVMMPKPNMGGTTLVFKIFLRPNELVSIDRCGVITAIDTVNKVVTVSSIPTNLTAGTKIDFVKSRPHFDILSYDKTLVSVDDVNLQITCSELPSTLAVGDYVCSENESPVPQIPAEVFPMLISRTTERCLMALGDFDGVKAIQARNQEVERDILTLLDNRVHGKAHKIVNHNTPFRLANRYFRKYWF